MLKIKTKVSKSLIPGAGKGLFAAQFVPKGTLVWEFDPVLDLATTDSEVDVMSVENKKNFTLHAYRSKELELWITCGDDAKYMNHSETPNLMSDSISKSSENRDIAAKDIQLGEEILCNYYDFDKDADRKLSTH